MSGGHSGEAIPVPIPNTEVKLSNADDTAFRGGKVGSCQTFFLFKAIHRKASGREVFSVTAREPVKMSPLKKSLK